MPSHQPPSTTKISTLFLALKEDQNNQHTCFTLGIPSMQILYSIQEVLQQPRSPSQLYHTMPHLTAVTTKKDLHKQVEGPTCQPPDFYPSVQSSIHIIHGFHTCTLPFYPRHHEVCNTVCPIWSRSTELVLLEIMRICELVE